MTLAEMKARLAEVKAEMRSIHEEAGDAPLGERQADWNTLDGELTTLLDGIKATEARMARLADLGDDKRSVEGAPAFVKTHTDAEVFDLAELRTMSLSGEDFLRKVEDNAKRAIERAEYGVRDKESAQEVAERHLLEKDNSSRDLAKRMLITGSKDYEAAFTKVMRSGNDSMCSMEERQALVRAAQALGTDASGGYAVPFQLDPTVVLLSSGVVNPIRELARVETIVGKEWQGVTSAGTTVQRGQEADAAPASNFTLGQPVVRTNRVQGYTVFSLEIDLSWSALRSEITRMLVDAKMHEEDSFITGTGNGTTDLLPQGINGGLGAGQNVITSGAVDAFTGTQAVTDLYNLDAALDSRWEANASLLAHKSFYTVLRNVDTAGGANMWARLGDGTPNKLLDYPVYRSTALPSVSSAQGQGAGAANAASSTLAILGDFKQFLIVDRLGMTVEMVPTVLNGSGMPTGQRGVYAVWMNNSKILVPDAFRRLSLKQA